MSPKKKNKRKSTQKPKNNKIINIFLLIFLFAFLATTLSYYIMKNENSNKSIKSNNILKKEEPKKPTNEIDEFKEKKLNEYFDTKLPSNENFEEYTKEFHKDVDINDEEKKDENIIIEDKVKVPLKELEKPKVDTNNTVVKPIEKEKTVEQKKEPIIKTPKIDESKIVTKKDTYVYDKKSKPKLVILIDDVSTQKQKDTILSIGYRVNMAFLPPTKRHPNSAKIAQDLPFHMIHFPMQASPAFKGAEELTLNITDSYETIEKRVKQLRTWYPNAKYTNNHTGSVFTENEEAVDKLFKALKKYNFIFVDSRTSAKSVIKKYAKKYNMPYIVRNTFIDNNQDYNAIQEQLKKAIAIAKKRGFAIAIGHPHSITLKVLKESKHLLKGVEPIFMNELPYL